MNKLKILCQTDIERCHNFQILVLKRKNWANSEKKRSKKTIIYK